MLPWKETVLLRLEFLMIVAELQPSGTVISKIHQAQNLYMIVY
jgi:hypothetical protein